MRHQEFIDLAEMCDFAIPRQFQQWQRFFVNEERFLEAAEQWLESKMQGVIFPRIEDDVDKGMIKNHQAQLSFERDEWDDSQNEPWWHQLEHIPYKGGKNWWSRWKQTLPMEHKLPAPSGLSGVSLATVF